MGLSETEAKIIQSGIDDARKEARVVAATVRGLAVDIARIGASVQKLEAQAHRAFLNMEPAPVEEVKQAVRDIRKIVTRLDNEAKKNRRLG